MKLFDEYFIQIMEQNHLKDVVIIGHIHPDGDCTGSVLGLAHYIKTSFSNYEVYPYLEYEDMDPQLKKFVLKDAFFKNLRQKPKLEHYAIIVCDTAVIEKVGGRDLLKNACVSLAIDHHLCHPSSYTDYDYVQIEESCSELIANLLSTKLLQENLNLERAQESLSPCAADYLYMGILHDTSRFTRASQLTLSVASQLVNMGVNHKYIVNETMQTQSLQDIIHQTNLLSQAERRCNGKIAYLCIDQNRISCEHISYAEIHPLSNILRDCADISVAFTMYEMSPKYWKFSFRSKDPIDVNKLVLPYGGGGHRNASSLMIQTPKPSELIEELIENLISQNTNLLGNS